VLDVRLPGLSGLELLAELARRGCAPPALVITAYVKEETRRESTRAGAVALLEKPFGDEALLEAVRRALTRDVTLA
jgi:two-component system, LuxR family, response regulator FixJ